MSEHYFSSSPSSEESHVQREYEIWGNKLQLSFASGVFSSAQLDKATSILLNHTEPPHGEQVILDLGCGSGAIACAIAAACPEARVLAIDVNERARALTKLNAQKNNLKIEVYAPEDVPADLRFDQIWSNPPIRIGKQALHEMLTTWLSRMDDCAYLVVAKNLGSDSLQTWLTEHGFPTTRLISVRGFRILQTEAAEAQP